jgi:hypothetical protein
MQSQQLIGGNFCLAKAGLTGLSGAATTFTTASAVLYSIIGKALSKSAVAGGATPTTDAVTGNAITLKAGQGTVVVWALDASGNVKAVQGSVETVDQAGNFQFAPPQFPSLPDTLTAFGYSIHKANPATHATPFAGGTWTFGTSLWNVTGTVHTANDLIAIPNRPQTS